MEAGLTHEERKAIHKYLADCIMRGEDTANESANTHQMALAAIRLDAEVNGLIGDLYGSEVVQRESFGDKTEQEPEAKVAGLEAQIEILVETPETLTKGISQDHFTHVLKTCLEILDMSFYEVSMILGVSEISVEYWARCGLMPQDPSERYRICNILLDKIPRGQHDEIMKNIYAYY